MCRIIVASGKIDVPKIIESMIYMAKDENSLHEMNEDVPGSWQHADGWGIAYTDKKGNFAIKKSAKAIFEDPEAQKLHTIKTDFLILHVRRKAGSEIALGNTHPFETDHSSLGTCIFCHNGCIADEISFNPIFKPKGKTDSERLFYSILSDIQENKDTKIAAVIRSNLQKYNKTKGSNIVLATKEKTYISMRKNEVPKYYGMLLATGEDFIMVSSEKLKTFPDIYWKSVLPEEVIIIQNKTAQFSISKEKMPILRKLVALIQN